MPDLWGAYQQPQVSPMGACSHLFLASKGGHIRGCPIAASSRATSGMSRAGAVPYGCFWHTATWANQAPTHTTSYFLANCCPHKHPQPVQDSGHSPRFLSLDKSKATGSATTCWSRAASLLRAPRGHAQPRAATRASLQPAAPGARSPLAGILEARHCSPPAVLPWRRFLCHQRHKGNYAFPGMQR